MHFKKRGRRIRKSYSRGRALAHEVEVVLDQLRILEVELGYRVRNGEVKSLPDGLDHVVGERGQMWLLQGQAGAGTSYGPGAFGLLDPPNQLRTPVLQRPHQVDIVDHDGRLRGQLHVTAVFQDGSAAGRSPEHADRHQSDGCRRALC